MNPEKAGSVEIANVKNFRRTHAQRGWCPRLAHAYHHQVLGFEHVGVKGCYDAAVASRTYAEVQHINGGKQRHYALNNAKEYFAEATEAFFGTNDFFRSSAELKQHDPELCALVEEVWETRENAKQGCLAPAPSAWPVPSRPPRLQSRSSAEPVEEGADERTIPAGRPRGVGRDRG
jgi:hypothetical protein